MIAMSGVDVLLLAAGAGDEGCTGQAYNKVVGKLSQPPISVGDGLAGLMGRVYLLPKTACEIRLVYLLSCAKIYIEMARGTRLPVRGTSHLPTSYPHMHCGRSPTFERSGIP